MRVFKGFARRYSRKGPDFNIFSGVQSEILSKNGTHDGRVRIRAMGNEAFNGSVMGAKIMFKKTAFHDKNVNNRLFGWQ